MYFIINDYLTFETKKIHTKRGTIAEIKKLYDPTDTLKVSSEYLKKYLTDKGFSSIIDVTCKYIVEDCVEHPYAITYKNFAIKCEKEYEIEGIEEQLFELNELAEPLFYYDHDLTFNNAIEWFKSTADASFFEDNPLGIDWETIVRRDYCRGTFEYEYSDNLVNRYIDGALYQISTMLPGDTLIINDLEITCH